MAILLTLVSFAASCESGTGVYVDSGKDVVLTADRLAAFVEREDPVIMTVTEDGRNVTSSSRVFFYKEGDAESSARVLQSDSFVPASEGRYILFAEHDGQRSASIYIEALSLETYESIYVRDICAMEFTGAWCTMCPDGLTYMNNAISLPMYDFQDKVHIMAFHSDSSGADALAIPATDEMFEAFSLGGYPSFVTDLRTPGGLSDGMDFLASLQESCSDYPAHCSVAVTSEVSGGTAKISVMLASELSLPYRVAVFVVEDGINYPQKGVLVPDDYVHFHVVRKVVSSSWKGDRIGAGIIASGAVAEKSFTVAVDPQWQIENTSVYVLAVDYAGYVNNMNICSLVDGHSDYKLK